VRGQSDLIATVLLIGVVLSLGAALLSLFGYYYIPIRTSADINLLVARQDALTSVLGRMSLNDTYVVVFGRSVERGNVYVMVVGVKSGSYYWRRLVDGVDYSLSVANASASGLFYLQNGTSPYWIVPQSIGVGSDRVYVKDLRVEESEYGMLSNKFGSDYFVTIYRLVVVPGETYLLRVRLLGSPALLGIDGLMVVFLMQYPGNGCWYMVRSVYFPVS